MPQWVIIFAGAAAVGVLLGVPVLLLTAQLRASGRSTFATVVAIIVWAFVSIVLAGVWFLVAVAAYKVDDSLTNVWIIANAAYPLVGIGIVLIHRRLLARRHSSASPDI